MITALLQIASPDGETPAERLDRVDATVAGLDHVDLVVLPELWAPGYFAFEDYERLAGPLDGAVVRRAASWAKAAGVWIQAGSVLELGSDGRLRNTAVLLAPDGSTALTYRKIHVFGYQSREAELLAPGEGLEVAQTPFATVGLSTCYDLRFPELYRCMVELGAHLVIVPAAWPQTRLDHWRLLVRARAVENQMFVLGCGAAGEQRGVQLSGHSVVVDPWGRVVAEAGGGEQVLYADVDLSLVAAIRAEFPALEDRVIRPFPPFGRPAGA